MHYTYFTKGVCSKKIDFDIDENHIISNISFLGGCDGNLQGISKLIEGQNVNDIIRKIEGIKCNGKSTSCPDQLSIALREAISKKQI